MIVAEYLFPLLFMVTPMNTFLLGEPLAAIDWVDFAWIVKYDYSKREYLEYERNMTFMETDSIKNPQPL